MATYLCGIDNGTTGTKAMVFDLAGNTLGEAYREYRCEFPKPGWVDQDAEMLFSSSCAALKAAIAQSGVNPRDIAAMGLSTQRCTMVPVDVDGLPIRMAISWQDARCTAECDWIRDHIGAERYYAITGLPIAPVWAYPAILWLRNHEPEIFGRAHKFLLTQEYILHRLGAEGYPEDWSNGSLQGLMEIDTFRWSKELVAESGLNLDQLPDLVPSGKMVGRVSKAAAELTGMVEGTPLVTGGGDQQCAGIGAGIIAPGLCEVTLGTAGVSLCFMDKPHKDPAMKMPCSAHAYPGKWECEGLQNAAGASYRWFRDTLARLETTNAKQNGQDPYELINIEVAKTPAGSRGLFYVPYLAGASRAELGPVRKRIVRGPDPGPRLRLPGPVGDGRRQPRRARDTGVIRGPWPRAPRSAHYRGRHEVGHLEPDAGRHLRQTGIQTGGRRGHGVGRGHPGWGRRGGILRYRGRRGQDGTNRSAIPAGSGHS